MGMVECSEKEEWLDGSRLRVAQCFAIVEIDMFLRQSSNLPDLFGSLPLLCKTLRLALSVFRCSFFSFAN